MEKPSNDTDTNNKKITSKVQSERIKILLTKMANGHFIQKFEMRDGRPVVFIDPGALDIVDSLENIQEFLLEFKDSSNISIGQLRYFIDVLISGDFHND